MAVATKTIHKLNYQLLVDSSKFKKGMVASRKELAMAKREMKAMATPAEKMEARLKKLGDLAKKDSKFQALHTLAVKRHREELKKSKIAKRIENTRKLTAAMKKQQLVMEKRRKEQERMNRLAAKSRKMNSMAAAAMIGGGVAAAVVGLKLTKDVAMDLNREFLIQVDRIDAIAKVADKLGTSTDFLTRLQFIAGRTSGLNEGQVSKGLEKMTRRVSEAAKGLGEAQNVLKEIGLDAQKLVDSGPERAFEMIARAMDGVTAEHDRLRIATKLFDDEQAAIHTTLRLSTKEFESLEKMADKFGVTISQFNADKMVAVKDAVTDLTSEWSSLKMEIAVEAAGPMATVFKNMRIHLEALKDFEGSGGTGVTGNFKRRLANAYEADFERRFEMGRATARSDRKGRVLKNKQALADEKASRKELVSGAFEFLDAKGLFGRKEVREKGTLFTQGKIKSEAVEGAMSLGIKSLIGHGVGLARRGEGLLSNIPGLQQKDQLSQQVTKRTTGPMASIAAGSSEAFKFLNQTTATKSIAVKLQEKGNEHASDAVDIMAQMRDIMLHGEKSEFANLESR